ncbi:uncharacterized protein Dyak_GE29012 [Drosophila yakuba]|uniref:Uncharacterized protein n=1 Tax=Drosophila yakuba TaxID=7245 RepID=A0A0R1E9N1_DROYA|nr:uncharacterized protein Dyak_GE29012 [Drosophila yakuba]
MKKVRRKSAHAHTVTNWFAIEGFSTVCPRLAYWIPPPLVLARSSSKEVSFFVHNWLELSDGVPSGF